MPTVVPLAALAALSSVLVLACSATSNGAAPGDGGARADGLSSGEDGSTRPSTDAGADAQDGATDADTTDQASAPPTTKIKWHPGHYMSSTVYTELGNLDGDGNPAGPEKAAEIAIVRAGPSEVLGWEGYYFWRALYDSRALDTSAAGSGLDADYVAVTGYKSGTGSAAVYDSPRRMGIYVLHTDYFDADPFARCVPSYILQSATYAPLGPDGKHYGYWTTTGASGSSSGSVCALWRSSVLNEYESFLQSLANHVLPDGTTVDTSPYVEWVKLYLETADSAGGATDSTYSPAAYLASYEALDTSAASAFPHTSIVSTLNWLDDPSDVVTLAGTLAKARAASGGPDIFGYSSGQNMAAGIAGLTWGQMAYVGLVPPGGGGTDWVSGGKDLRGTVPYLGTVQNTETVYNGAHNYTPLDIFRQAEFLKATHVAWQYVRGQTGSLTVANWLGTASSIALWNSAPGTWGGALDMIYANALSNTAYPASYP